MFASKVYECIRFLVPLHTVMSQKLVIDIKD
jgi:hypothetical protein